jgi:hypothetical protein
MREGKIVISEQEAFTWLFRQIVPGAENAVVHDFHVGDEDEPNIIMRAMVDGEIVTKMIAKVWIKEDMAHCCQ